MQQWTARDTSAYTQDNRNLAALVYMRSADFRAGLIRVASLGKHVFAVQEIPVRRVEFPKASRRWLLAGGAVALTVLLVAAWYSGRESAGLEAQRVSAEVNQLAQQMAATRLALKQQKATTAQLEKALGGSANAAKLTMESQLRRQLLQAQAEANQFRAILERERQATSDRSQLIESLRVPGAHLLSLKGVDTAAESTAYALIVPNSHLVFIASNLPPLPDGRQYQLWLLRKQDPKFVSAGLFTPDNADGALMSFNDPAFLSDMTAVAVTQEPEGGSSAPSGTKLLESTNGGDEQGRAREDQKLQGQ